MARRIALPGSPGAEHRESWETAIEQAIVDALVGRPEWAKLLVVSRALQAAIAMIRAQADSDIDLVRLSASAAVTLRTLRETFSACFGISLAAFILETRLAGARERLSSGYDSRPIQAIAEAAGFKSSSSFSRAYARRFGETPTQSRTRGVAEGIAFVE